MPKGLKGQLLKKKLAHHPWQVDCCSFSMFIYCTQTLNHYLLNPIFVGIQRGKTLFRIPAVTMICTQEMPWDFPSCASCWRSLHHIRKLDTLGELCFVFWKRQLLSYIHVLNICTGHAWPDTGPRASGGQISFHRVTVKIISHYRIQAIFLFVLSFLIFFFSLKEPFCWMAWMIKTYSSWIGQWLHMKTQRWVNSKGVAVFVSQSVGSSPHTVLQWRFIHIQTWCTWANLSATRFAKQSSRQTPHIVIPGGL